MEKPFEPIISAQEIMDAVPVWIFFKDRQNNFINVNRAFAQAMGMSKEKIAGRSVFDLFPRDRAEAYWRDDQEVLASGKPKKEIIEDAQIASGKKVWVETLKIPYRDKSGEIVGIIGFSIDITERKKVEDDLSLKATLLEAQLSNSLDGILAIGTDRKVLLYNQRFIDMWGIPSSIVKTKDDKKMLEHIIKQLMDPKEFIDKVEYLYIHPSETARDVIEFKDGRVFERYTAPLLDKEGGDHGRIWYFHDNTAHQQYMRELEKMNDLMVGRELKMADLKNKIKDLESRQSL